MGERGRRMRGASMVATVALAAVTLSGCSLIGDGQQVWNIIQQDAAQQEALKVALVELRALDGVTAVSSRFRTDGPSGDEADINVVAARGVTTPQLVNIATIAGKALAAEQPHFAVPLFTLEVEGGGSLEQTEFALIEDQLATEIGYWRAVEETIGAGLTLKLVESGGEPSYRREFTPAPSSAALRVTEQFIANYAALQALADDSPATSWWFLPGVSAQPDLPPEELVTLLDDIRQVVPVLDYTGIPEDAPPDYDYPEGGSVSWNQLWPGGPMYAAVFVNQGEHRASDWPVVLEVAALTAAVPQLSFSYNAAGAPGEERQFRFYTSNCGGEVFVTQDDRALIDALGEAGVVLPAGGGPGFCQPPPPGS